MKNLNQLEMLIDAINSLPSIGKKNATRIAYFLLKKDERFIHEFVKRIIDAKQNLKFCKQCNNLAIDSICDICLNSKRDHSTICVVSQIEDINIIESSNSYNGLYFVLNGEISVRNNVNLSDIYIENLLNRINYDDQIKEVILATNFTMDGEVTALYIKNALAKKEDLIVSRIAMGLPMNSSLNYADGDTLFEAIKNRKKL